MTFSGVLGATWDMYVRFFLKFFLLALVVFAAVNAVFAVLVEALGTETDGRRLLVFAIGAAISLVGTFWLQGAMVFAVEDVRDGTSDSSTMDILRKVSPHLGTLVLAGILAGFAIGVGFMLLVIPGLFLLTIWSVIAPSIVVEGKRVPEAFSRSLQLVR
ncbi:MAG: hypothetical protein FJW96_15085, partial [Actinobacteria bacterium]|nr:hypothetical protein [Actinomycetota bacterium]